MPAVLAETRIAAEQQSIDDIDRQLAQLEVELREALLLTDNDEEVARLDTKIASLKREREHHLLRIDSLRAQEALAFAGLELPRPFDLVVDDLPRLLERLRWCRHGRRAGEPQAVLVVDRDDLRRGRLASRQHSAAADTSTGVRGGAEDRRQQGRRAEEAQGPSEHHAAMRTSFWRRRMVRRPAT